MPSDEHIELMTKFFEKHYGKKYSEMFTKIVENQKYKYFTKHEQHKPKKQPEPQKKKGFWQRLFG